MLLAAPRSGTAWAANYFTQQVTLCLHDPLWDIDYRELDAYAADSLYAEVGIACTGLALQTDFVNAHPAPKVILHRPREEVSVSLHAIGLPPCAHTLYASLWKVNGLHVEWTELFSNPKPICEYLGQHFDQERHKMLRSMRVTSKWTERAANHSPKALAAMKDVLAGVV